MERKVFHVTEKEVYTAFRVSEIDWPVGLPDAGLENMLAANRNGADLRIIITSQIMDEVGKVVPVLKHGWSGIFGRKIDPVTIDKIQNGYRELPLDFQDIINLQAKLNDIVVQARIRRIFSQLAKAKSQPTIAGGFRFLAKQEELIWGTLQHRDEVSDFVEITLPLVKSLEKDPTGVGLVNELAATGELRESFLSDTKEIGYLQAAKRYKELVNILLEEGATLL